MNTNNIINNTDKEFWFNYYEISENNYNGALYFCGTNCLKYTSKIRMIKLENVNKFCRKMGNTSYIFIIGDNTIRN